MRRRPEKQGHLRRPECIFYGRCLDHHARLAFGAGQFYRDTFDCAGCARYEEEDRIDPFEVAGLMRLAWAVLNPFEPGEI